jgi:hypothetical protein
MDPMRIYFVFLRFSMPHSKVWGMDPALAAGFRAQRRAHGTLL